MSERIYMNDNCLNVEYYKRVTKLFNFYVTDKSKTKSFYLKIMITILNFKLICLLVSITYMIEIKFF